MAGLQLRILAIALLLVAQWEISRASECQYTDQGKEYTGNAAETENGKTCVSWTKYSAHNKHTFPDATVAAADNFCRNPTSDPKGPWCYTDEAGEKEYCKVPKCRVTEITPGKGGLSGGTLFTIRGQGFASIDAIPTNVVKFVSNANTYPCILDVQECSPTQITCMSKDMPQDWYTIRVTVGAKEFPGQAMCNGRGCSVLMHYWHTPRIFSVSGPAEDGTVKACGDFYTDAYANKQSSNKRTSRIEKVVTHGLDSEDKRPCDMVKPDGTLYGVSLNKDANGESGHYGCLTCKPYNNVFGALRLSFTVTGGYGASTTMMSTIHSNSLFGPEMFQVYGEITSVEPVAGSTEGGTSITIKGRFSNSPGIKVNVAGQPCTVKSITSSEVVCTTGSKQYGNVTEFPGNRGCVTYTWTEYSQYTGTLDDVVSDETKYPRNASLSKWHDSFSANWPDGDRFVTLTKAFFKAPVTGEYQFFAKSDDESDLYFSMNGSKADMVKIASASTAVGSYTQQGDAQSSDRLSLTKGESYYMEMAHKERWNGASIDVAVKVFNSPSNVTSEVAGDAVQEEQVVQLRSIQVSETQVLTFNNLATQTETNQVQTVTVETASATDTSYTLEIDGVSTSSFNFDTRDSAMKSALQDMAVKVKVISVSRAFVSNTKAVYTVTFKGSVPVMTAATSVVAGSNETITVNVEEATPGKTSAASFKLKHGNAFSDSIDSDVTANDDVAHNQTLENQQLEKEIEEIYQARCPTSMLYPMGALYSEGYEYSDPAVVEAVTTDMIPFCGKRAYKNPTNILINKNFRIPNEKYAFCLAYKATDDLELKFIVTNGREQHIAKSLPSATGSWQYTCLEIIPFLYTTDPPTTLPTQIYLKSVEVRHTDKSLDSDFYVDQISVTPESVNTADHTKWRIAPPAMMESITVTDIRVNAGDAPQFQVDLTPYMCVTGFDLIAVQFASEDLTGNSATVTGMGWPANANIAVTRTTSASVPITGTFDLSYKGKQLTGLPVDISAKDLRMKLEDVEDETMQVKMDADTCHNRAWRVKWVSVGGNQPAIQMDGSNLSGNNVSVALDETDGHIFMKLWGDLVRTVHDKPQVTMMVDDLPVKCTNNCDFEYSEAKTPTVSGITSSRKKRGTCSCSTLTISGTGFGTNENTTKVILGDKARCDISAISSTEITCDICKAPAGDLDVMVITPDGKAKFDQQASHTYDLCITCISPVEGSRGGGIPITITGRGLGANTTVKFGDVDCPIVPGSAKYDSIECTPAAVVSPGAVDVNITSGGQDMTSPCQFTFKNDLTPVVTSISVTNSSVSGGEVIEINGTQLGNDSVTTVRICNKQARNVSVEATKVVAEIPANDPQSCKVEVLVADQGVADLLENNVPELEYILDVNHVSPKDGSLEGGTKVTITGRGFGMTKSDVAVAMESSSCEVLDVSDTEIVCRTTTVFKTHDVDNTGVHKVHGAGYAWSSKVTEITEGDSVCWSWRTEAGLKDINYKVEQLETETSEEYFQTGFRSSENGTANGDFCHQFVEDGTYHYWSGKVGPNYVTMLGKVVVAPRTDKALPIKVTVSGHEALYNVDPNANETVDASNCGSLRSEISGCTTLLPTVSDTTRFYFGFVTCKTPVITEITQTPESGAYATALDAIVITGTGFSVDVCQNEVKLGDDYSCTVASGSNSTMITCHPATQNTMPVATNLKIKLRIGNLGYATIRSTKKDIAIYPYISSLTPNVGSMEGLASVKITGSGLDGTGQEIVILAGEEYMIDATDYTTISLQTKEESMMMPISGNAQVQVERKGNRIYTLCRPESACSFNVSEAGTPTVDGVSPNEVNGSETTLTINGTSFGTNESAVSVSIGGEDCVIQGGIQDTQVQVKCSNLPVGNRKVRMVIEPNGLAKNADVRVNSLASISSISPTAGSIEGSTKLTISGNGFVSGSTEVKIGGAVCTDLTVTLSSVVCTTSPGSAGSASVVVKSDGTTYQSQTYEYSSAQTPSIQAISPTSEVAGTEVTITGSGFGTQAAAVTMFLGQAECTVNGTVQDDEIKCTAGPHRKGDAGVEVYISGKGKASGSVTFTYQLSTTSISPTSGGFGGGQLLTITGSGYRDQVTEVTVCGALCMVEGSIVSTSEFICVTPAGVKADTSDSTKQCDVIVSVDGDEAQSNPQLQYTYDDSKTPTITKVEPTRGGTMGGTKITITGTGFSNTLSDNSVSIGGSVCDLEQAGSSDTVLVCTTNAKKGSVPVLDVIATVDGSGSTVPSKDSKFYYIDVWSSTATWGGLPVPVEGDLVACAPGQVILIDETTALLKMLLIDGCQVIFDDKDIDLHADMIMITNGGLLQIGTEEKPFLHKANIKLHGTVRSKELPIYGAKVLAVRNGTLELHGKPIEHTWTRLAQTVNAGESEITLEKAVCDWNVGDEIVIATTGNQTRQIESEKAVISAISQNCKTLTLEAALKYEHKSESKNYGSRTLEMFAEVGLLTRNIKVSGSTHAEWAAQEVAACEAGFDVGEFSTQTCFQGRFGDEVGSDGFGGHIILHAPMENDRSAMAHVEYVELTNMGQEFRLGRYPIHFHLLADMEGAYVRGCAIHATHNRAVNIHKTHYVLVERNVAYNIKGGAFFLEDGGEIGNTLQNNLAVLVKQSTSLRNDDITPAAFWVTNPNNTVRHNTAAGGSHFGFWYRMTDHPEGPSHDVNICPKAVPVKEFSNNVVHSNGWYGLWIFESYFPMKDGKCGATESSPAVFEKFTVYNCQRGAEGVNVGAIQFKDFLMVGNVLAGIEVKQISKVEKEKFYTDEGPLVEGATIVAAAGQTSYGLVVPYAAGMKFTNVAFYDYNEKTATIEQSALKVARIDGTCTYLCGGWEYSMAGMEYHNSNKAIFDWPSDGVVYDVDGSTTGSVGQTVVPALNTLSDSDCQASADFSFGVPAVTCKAGVSFIRLGLNLPSPESLMFKNLMVTNTEINKTDSSPHSFKRLTHKSGWMIVLQSGKKYHMEWQNAESIYNMSYAATYFGLREQSCVTICHTMQLKPDKAYITKQETVPMSNSEVSCSQNVNGDWSYNAETKEFCYLISGKKVEGTDPQDIAADTMRDRPVKLEAFRCFWADCIPPPDPNSLPPVRERPAVFQLWSNPDDWKEQGSNPLSGGDVVIPKDKWVVVDRDLPTFKRLLVLGTLELDNSKDHDIEASFIIVYGRLIVGWEDKPYPGNCRIKLVEDDTGRQYEQIYNDYSGPFLGVKVIGVFGGIDAWGNKPKPYFTRLSQTVDAGSTEIHLLDDVSWVEDDEIIITSTSYSAWDTETHFIKSVSADKKTITLKQPLGFKHLGTQVTHQGHSSFYMSAEVGLLTRNIKIYGRKAADLTGPRMLVTTTSRDSQVYKGWVRLHDVEFVNTGQESFTANYDPRFTLSFLGTGEVSNIKPSDVAGLSIHHGYATAIGVFGATGLILSDNIIHHTVGAGLVIDGSDAISLLRNLITLTIWPGGFNGRREYSNYDYPAGVEAMVQCTNLVMENNVVAGVERFGYHVKESCDEATKWSNNVAHSLMNGVTVMVTKDQVPEKCIRFSGFFIWKAFEIGMYTQSPANNEFTNNYFADNNLAIYPMIHKPEALSHVIEDKYVKVEDSHFVGTSDSFDCNVDKRNMSDVSVKLSRNAASWGGSNTLGRVGVAFPTCSGAWNEAPIKPFTGIMAYPILSCSLRMKGVTFNNFKGDDCGLNGATRRDIAVSTTPMGDDLQHEVIAEGITWEGTNAEDMKVLYHEPRAGAINPADCVDMDCDGQKKTMIRDSDGSFYNKAGVPRGTVIPISEFQWDGDDKRRGLGNFRIPKTMLTDIADGSKLDADTLFPNKGIYRKNEATCVKNTVWNAYYCTDVTYRMMIIESMDADTESRRLSPVALASEGYIDLINGPQDMGWCSGYTCQKRISTFYSLVATGLVYNLHFTSITPQELRLFLINSEPTDSLVVVVFYTQPLRLDVYQDGQYVDPTNAYTNSDGKLAYHSPTAQNTYKPTPDNAPGSNFFDRDTNELHIVVKGTGTVIIKTKQVVMMSLNMPPMSVDDFYGTNLLANLANFLGVPEDKIRVVKIIRESGRRKRSTGSTTVQIEIGDPPNSNGTLNETAPDAMSSESLTNASASIINALQLGLLDQALNTTILGCDIVEPPPAPSDPKWSEQTSSSAESMQITVQIPASMELVDEPVGDQEGSLFPTQPKLRVLDSSGNSVGVLGSRLDPWQLTAVLRKGAGSDSSAQLMGTTSIPYKDGWFNFTDLFISHSGSGYTIDFEISSPSEAIGKFAASSAAIAVAEQQLKIAVVSHPTNVTANNAAEVVVEIQDFVTGTKHHNIAWKGHTWVCTVSLAEPNVYNGGSLTGTTSVTVDPSTSQANFADLQFTDAAQYVLKFNVQSTPSKYALTGESDIIDVTDASCQEPVAEVSKNVTLQFDADFSKVDSKFVIAMVTGHIKKKQCDVELSNFEVTEGSVVVVFALSGRTASMTTVLDGMANDAKTGLNLQYGSMSFPFKPFMSVDGGAYSGLDGSVPTTTSGSSGSATTDKPKVAPSDGSGFPIAAIIGCAVAGVLLIVMIIVIVIVMKKKNVKRIGSTSTMASSTGCPERQDSRASPLSTGNLSPRPSSMMVDEKTEDLSPRGKTPTREQLYDQGRQSTALPTVD